MARRKVKGFSAISSMVDDLWRGQDYKTAREALLKEIKLLCDELEEVKSHVLTPCVLAACVQNNVSTETRLVRRGIGVMRRRAERYLAVREVISIPVLERAQSLGVCFSPSSSSEYLSKLDAKIDECMGLDECVRGDGYFDRLYGVEPHFYGDRYGS